MQPASVSGNMLQLVTFKIAGQKYAVDVLKVQEINYMNDVTLIPNSPPFLEGAVNLRGRVIPVLNLRKKFRIETTALREQTKIVIMDINRVVMGLMVDSVSDVLRIPGHLVEPPPPVSSSMNTEFIAGIAKLDDGLVILLDMDKLLGTEEHMAAAEGSTIV